MPALAALLACAGLDRPAAAQPVGAAIQIEWQVKNRFRLFRRDADFQRHVMAARAGSQLAAERLLERDADGRGWAQDMLEHLCIDAAGSLLDSCERDGESENYLAPKTHLVVVRLTGAVPANATCNWSFDDGTIPPQQVNAACSEAVQPRLRYGKLTIAAVGITRPDNSVESVSTEIQVRDLLIAGLGDSVASGEGNPDRPIALADEGFCFRRFLGTVRSEYFRPSRLGYDADKACDDTPAGPGPAATSDWISQGARWMSAACHRSLYSYQLRAALALAVESKHVAVTFIPLACTGASIEIGLFDSQGASECPPRGRCAGSVPAQIEQLQDTLGKARASRTPRASSISSCSPSAPTTSNSPALVADVIITSGVERVLFNQGGLIATVPQAQRIARPRLSRRLRQAARRAQAAGRRRSFARRLRVLRPSGDARRRLLPRRTRRPRRASGVHRRRRPAAARDRFRADEIPAEGEGAGALRRRSQVRQSRHRPHDLRRFPSGGIRPAWILRAFAATIRRSTAIASRPTATASIPTRCRRRPRRSPARAGRASFAPYASRARWIRTANDSYFAAMTFPHGMPSTMQPSNIHDATWGALSAVYGGAFHPSAEGQAAMADAALPAVRDVLGVRPPPSVIAEPLPPPAPAGAQ